MDKIIAEGCTEETGKIIYRVTCHKIFGIRIEQERGILKTAEVKNITKSRDKIIDFAKTLANGNVTATALYGVCDDFTDAGKLP